MPWPVQQEARIGVYDPDLETVTLMRRVSNDFYTRFKAAVEAGVKPVVLFVSWPRPHPYSPAREKLYQNMLAVQKAYDLLLSKYNDGAPIEDVHVLFPTDIPFRQEPMQIRVPGPEEYLVVRPQITGGVYLTPEELRRLAEEIARMQQEASRQVTDIENSV